MQWQDSYSIGIEEIDSQHRMLLDNFTLVEEAIRRGGGWSEIHFPLRQLRVYAEMHFSTEESLMRMSDYPGTEQHIESHRNILQKLIELEKQSLQTDVCAELTAVLRNWLLGHIMHADLDYARHFANGGRILVRRSAIDGPKGEPSAG
jgi:hemerythrin-like metal-binding protein